MLFSSLIFLHAFLPLALLFTWLTPSRYQNYTLLFFSLIFYAWSGPGYSLIVIFSVVFNYFFGLYIQKYEEEKKVKRILAACIGGNLLLLIIIKYTPFIFSNLNAALDLVNINPLQIPEIKLIPGISFFTFHSISYAVDIYRRQSVAQKNFFSMGLYIIFFPQLIAGPIVRYHEIETQFQNRKISLDFIFYGARRFIQGLIKKVIFANTFAYPADEIFKLGTDHISTGTAWFGIICYTLHIYFDFSGYSDMAIGLAKMFGFTFPENFNFPYVARSVQDFWRRWHMTLSRWFRDYVYLPLGGNRSGKWRMYFNLIFVFFLTGFWHGASWSMIIWGLFHGFFLIVERIGFKKYLDKMFLFNNLYTLMVVMIAWVFFRSPSLSYAIEFIQRMFSFFNPDQNIISSASIYMNREFNIILIMGVILALRIPQTIYEKLKLKDIFWFSRIINFARYSLLLVLFIVCVLYLNRQGYNPFIYFQF